MAPSSARPLSMQLMEVILCTTNGRNRYLSSFSTDETSEKAVVIQFQSTMPALKSKGPIWYQLWLDVRHIPIAIYKILLNGPYMLITFGMSIDGIMFYNNIKLITK
jgi:hypothetical protein